MRPCASCGCCEAKWVATMHPMEWPSKIAGLVASCRLSAAQTARACSLAVYSGHCGFGLSPKPSKSSTTTLYSAGSSNLRSGAQTLPLAPTPCNKIIDVGPAPCWVTCSRYGRLSVRCQNKSNILLVYRGRLDFAETALHVVPLSELVPGALFVGDGELTGFGQLGVGTGTAGSNH